MEIEKISKWMKMMFFLLEVSKKILLFDAISFALTLAPSPMPMQGNQPPTHPVIGNQI